METVRESVQKRGLFHSFGSEQIGVLDTLGQHEYDILSMLLDQRRALPVYRAGLWCCHECGFYSTDIEAVGHHLLMDHDPAPPDPEEIH